LARPFGLKVAQVCRLHLPRLPGAETLKQDLLRFEIPIQANANELYGAFRVGNQDDRGTALGLAVHVDPGHRLLMRRPPFPSDPCPMNPRLKSQLMQT
jgi:hypothetical protein